MGQLTDPSETVPSVGGGRGMRTALRSPLALAIALVAVLLASFLHELHLTSGIDDGASDFSWLLCLGLIAGVALAFGPTWALVPHAWAAGNRETMRARQYGCAAVAALCALLSAWLVREHDSPTVATIAWVLGLLLVLAAATDTGGTAAARALWRRRQFVCGPAVVLLGILIAAAILRLPNLDTIPGYIHNDEASNGLTARGVAQGQYLTLFTNGWASLPLLGYSWDALFFKLFGDSLTSLRLSSAVLGLGSIVVVALLGRELFSVRAGLVAAALLTVFHVHIHFSRVGHHYIQALFAVTLTLYLLVLWLRHGRHLAAVGAGILLSIDLQVYYAARVAYVIVPVVIGYVLLSSERDLRRQRLPAIGWLVLGWFVGVAPIGTFILGNWSDFTERTREVLVLSGSTEARVHVYGMYGTHDSVYILRTQLWRVLQAFNRVGDSSEQYGIGHPMLDPLSAAILPAALAYAVFRVRRAGFALCLIAFASILLVGGVSTIDPPFWPRLIVIMPILALLLGAFLDGLWQVVDQVPRLRWPAAAAAFALLIAIANGNYTWYFTQFEPLIRTNSLAVPMDVGKFLRPLHDSATAYGISNGGFYVTHQAIQLLAPQVPGCDLTLSLSLQHCATPPGHDNIFVIAPDGVSSIPALKKACPGGILTVLRRYDLGQRFYIYRVHR